jgi:hypothetical protein
MFDKVRTSCSRLYKVGVFRLIYFFTVTFAMLITLLKERDLHTLSPPPYELAQESQNSTPGALRWFGIASIRHHPSQSGKATCHHYLLRIRSRTHQYDA